MHPNNFQIKPHTSVHDKRADYLPFNSFLTNWGGVTHILVGNPTIIGSDNGVSPGPSQAVI